MPALTTEQTAARAKANAEKAADATAEATGKPRRGRPPKVREQSAQATKSILDRAAIPSVQLIPLSLIEAGQNPRTIFDEADTTELAESIREHGLQQPIVIRQLEPDRYEIIMGERRFRAFTQLLRTDHDPRWEHIPAMVNATADNAAAFELALIENLHRVDLNAMDEAQGYATLAGQFHLTTEQIADKVKRSKRTVQATMSLTKLPPKTQQLLQNNELSRATAITLLSKYGKFPAALDVIAAYGAANPGADPKHGHAEYELTNDLKRAGLVVDQYEHDYNKGTKIGCCKDKCPHAALIGHLCFDPTAHKQQIELDKQAAKEAAKLRRDAIAQSGLLPVSSYGRDEIINLARANTPPPEGCTPDCKCRRAALDDLEYKPCTGPRCERGHIAPEGWDENNPDTWGAEDDNDAEWPVCPVCNGNGQLPNDPENLQQVPICIKPPEYQKLTKLQRAAEDAQRQRDLQAISDEIHKTLQTMPLDSTLMALIVTQWTRGITQDSLTEGLDLLDGHNITADDFKWGTEDRKQLTIKLASQCTPEALARWALFALLSKEIRWQSDTVELLLKRKLDL